MTNSYIFDKCCGCIELRTGCLIIGYLNLIGGIIGIVVASVIAVNPSVILRSDKIKEQVHDEHDAVAYTTSAAIAAIILIILFVFAINISIVYLVGIYQNKRGYVKIYMVFTVIFLVIYTVMFFVSFASPEIKTSEVFFRILNILLNVYFVLVIRSYYYKMNDASSQPFINNTA